MKRLLRAILCLATAAPAALPASGQGNHPAPYVFSTFAGASSIGSADGAGQTARFYAPTAVALDRSGNLYIADQLNHTIRRISATGTVTTIAGQYGRPGWADGSGAAVRFDQPSGVVVDASGAVYVADRLNHVIRRIAPGGAVTTVAGSPGVAGAADGTGRAARFNGPRGLALGGDGVLYVADAGNHAIRAVSAAGVVSTVAGGLGIPGNFDGPPLQARFDSPAALALGAGGTLFVADTGNDRICAVTATAVTTLSEAMDHFFIPMGIAADAAGAVFVADTGNALIRRILPDGSVTTVAGRSYLYYDDIVRFYRITGCADGPGTTATLSGPAGIAVDAGGVLYVADNLNNNIRRIGSGPEAPVTTIAGLGDDDSHGRVDATGSAARFTAAEGVAVAPNGDVLVADGCVRRIDRSASVSTVTVASGGTAQAVAAASIAAGADGNVYTIEPGTSVVRALSPSGVLATLNRDSIISQPGSPVAQLFYQPAGITADGDGATAAVYATSNEAVWRVNPDGGPQPIAGDASYNPMPGTGYDRAGSADGTGTAARFRNPTGIALGAAGVMYVADTDNHTIRRVTAAGEGTTIAGQPGTPGSDDGRGGEARFRFPEGVAVNREGDVFVADTGNHTVRRITPAGVVTTVGGLPGAVGSADGVGAEARFEAPSAIAVDRTGILYVAGGTSVRRGQPAGPPVITVQPRSQSAAPGAAVTFSVEASGLPAPTFQWCFRGQPINGATANVLSLAGVRPDDAGPYSVVATNAAGTATSETVTLMVAAGTGADSSAPGGGGGAVSWWFLIALAGLGFARTCRGARSAR